MVPRSMFPGFKDKNLDIVAIYLDLFFKINVRCILCLVQGFRLNNMQEKITQHKSKFTWTSIIFLIMKIVDMIPNIELENWK